MVAPCYISMQHRHRYQRCMEVDVVTCLRCDFPCDTCEYKIPDDVYRALKGEKDIFS